MTGIFAGILVGVLGTIIAWGARAIFLRRQLNLIQPKLLEYSGLGSNAGSKTVEVTIINAGRLPEEDVRVQFSPNLRYTVLASSAAGLTIGQDGILRIDRLSPKQEITVILYVEQGEFRRDHIQGITSKNGIGKIKNTLQEARQTPLEVLGAFIIVVFVIIPFGYGVGKVVETIAWPTIEKNLFSGEPIQFSAGKAQVVTAAYGLKQTAIDTAISTVKILGISRKGTDVYIQISLNNTTQDRLTYTLATNTSIADQRPIGDNEYIISNIVVFPGTSKIIELADYLPKNVTPQELVLSTQVTRNSDLVSYDQEIKLE